MTFHPRLRHLAPLLMAFPAYAFAALGGDAASVQTDRVHMKGAQRAAHAESKFTVHEIVTPAGTMVKEYATADGIVFAVSWQGPAMPDLQQVLGAHFKTYSAAASSKHGGHGHVEVQRTDLVVHSGGHARAFSGKAYLPNLLPANVAVEDLQ